MVYIEVISIHHGQLENTALDATIAEECTASNESLKGKAAFEQFFVTNLFHFSYSSYQNVCNSLCFLKGIESCPSRFTQLIPTPDFPPSGLEAG